MSDAIDHDWRRMLAGSRTSAFFVCVASAIAYILINLYVVGPAYLGDEIGYLSNAAFLAGHHSDGASSYYAGYSLLISPLFYFFTDARQVWAGILAVNGVMWGGTLYLVWSLLRTFVPDAPEWKRLIVLVVIAAYPAYSTMSGYAFAQTAFALVFTAGMYSLVRLDTARPLTILPHSLLVGYLASIHPAGLPVAVASVLSIVITCWHGRAFRIAVLNGSIIALLVFFYHGIIRPWMIAEMTAPGADQGLHYPGVSAVLAGGGYGQKLRILIGMMAGQLSYLLIATFGFAAIGAVVAARQSMHQLRNLGEPGSDGASVHQAALPAMLILSVLGIIALSALGSAVSGGPGRLDHWVYGRYVEPAIATLFGIGLLSRAPRVVVFATASGVLLTGAFLVHYIGISGPLYPMNVPALWPYFAFQETGPLAWFVAGALGIVTASILNRQVVCAAIAIIYALCVSPQQDWHQRVLDYNSTPSDIPEFVTRNFGVGTCVAFDANSSLGLGGIAEQRANLYSFYLFSSPLVRMSPAEWLDHCDGPLLTFNPELDLEGVEYVGREVDSRLYVVVRSGGSLTFPRARHGKQYWKSDQSERCLVAGCFSMQGAELGRYSQVGRASERGVETDGRAGYLLHGPYAGLRAGEYLVRLKGEFGRVEGARIDIVSQSGQFTHFESALDELDPVGEKEVGVPLHLLDDAQALEIRIHVSSRDQMSLAGYQIEVQDPARLDVGVPPRMAVDRTGFSYQGAALADLPSQVGEMSDGELVSGGREGFLVYGPYRRMGPGRYSLVVRGRAGEVQGAWTDVVSSGGRKTHAYAPVAVAAGNDGSEMARAEVVIDETVEDLEIRVFSPRGSAMALNGYTFEPIQ